MFGTHSFQKIILYVQHIPLPKMRDAIVSRFECVARSATIFKWFTSRSARRLRPLHIHCKLASHARALDSLPPTCASDCRITITCCRLAPDLRASATIAHTASGSTLTYCLGFKLVEASPAMAQGLPSCFLFGDHREGAGRGAGRASKYTSTNIPIQAMRQVQQQSPLQCSENAAVCWHMC